MSLTPKAKFKNPKFPAIREKYSENTQSGTNYAGFCGPMGALIQWFS
jgi:hypothetical protein